ncbi:MAG: 4-hydroxy-tetrahydrodipicolinate synthase [Clostridiales bacterium]|jgi:4-hydroxy-tetrahydrodipicolinate synthase|nr:4-hydroxy-tetrahydrodipicolinate synthase [Clostridiales bacterium]
MKNTIFTGSGVALVTPFTSDNKPNHDKIKELVDFQINNKTDAIISCGTTGEASTMTDAEHLSVVETTIKQANKRVPVIAGTGSNDTMHAIELSKESQKLGADGLLIVNPYYNKTSTSGLIKHYIAIADSVDIPIVVYNVPSRTGANIPPKIIAELSKHKNIVAVKEASGDISQIAELANLCGDNIDIYSGNDDQISPVMALGGAGVISTIGNIMPKETHDIVQKFLNGDVAGSIKLQLNLIPLIGALFCEVNPIPVKTALNLMGYDVGELRMPLCEMSAAAKERLIAEMTAIELI